MSRPGLMGPAQLRSAWQDFHKLSVLMSASTANQPSIIQAKRLRMFATFGAMPMRDAIGFAPLVVGHGLASACATVAVASALP